MDLIILLFVIITIIQKLCRSGGSTAQFLSNGNYTFAVGQSNTNNVTKPACTAIIKCFKDKPENIETIDVNFFLTVNKLN